MLALGNFDGLHRGHVKIIERVNRRAGERGSTSVVMTFDPHPPRVVRPDKAPPLIMTKEQRLEAIAATGIQGAAVVRFTRDEISDWGYVKDGRQIGSYTICVIFKKMPKDQADYYRKNHGFDC